ncbi:MAG: hypothetical protein WKF73_18400 [Nocardioidaceae bacterium]
MIANSTVPTMSVVVTDRVRCGRVRTRIAGNALRWPMRRRFRAESTPWVTFTRPEVARVGLTEAETAGRGGRIAYLPMTEVDRAIAVGVTDGFVTTRSPLWPSC